MAKKIIKSAIVAVIKNQLIDYIVKSSLSGVASGIRYNVVYLTVDYVFDLYLTPILEELVREGVIYQDVKKVKAKVKEYEDAKTRRDRIDRFNDIP
jgi:hypothetical protein